MLSPSGRRPSHSDPAHADYPRPAWGAASSGPASSAIALGRGGGRGYRSAASFSAGSRGSAMDRSLVVSIGFALVVTLGCQANRQAGLDPFNGRQRVPPPGTGAVGTNPDPY